MEIKMSERNRKLFKQWSRWSILIMSAFALATSFANAASNETLKLILENPEIAQYSTLVQNWYLLFL